MRCPKQLKSNIGKMKRLWPLLLICLVACAVLFFSLKSIISDTIHIGQEPDSAVPEATQSLPPAAESYSPAPGATASPFPETTATPLASPSAEPATPAPPAATAEPAPAPAENAPAEAAAPAAVAETHIDNQTYEYSGNYESVEAGSNNIAAICSSIMSQINQQRAAYGLSALNYDSNLYPSAVTRAEETAVSFSHYRPNGSDCFSVFPAGYTYMGENLASADNIISDEDFASGCVQWWMASSGHRDNILNPSFTNTAVAVYISGNSMYAVQLFGTP